ncbi:U11/U12 small nuclear ribonucleoprotein 25 kDa protein, partial [Cebus imitator]|uniref:U11/U12 small nuclear ribonucleoprotein 25 kDa protein n=1 Tax=Cebus imitator TaxID=2715852 RepID=UPI00189C25CC
SRTPQGRPPPLPRCLSAASRSRHRPTPQPTNRQGNSALPAGYAAGCLALVIGHCNCPSRPCTNGWAASLGRAAVPARARLAPVVRPGSAGGSLLRRAVLEQPEAASRPEAPEDDEDEEEALPHSEAVDVFQEGLAMVVQDPLLCDLPIQVCSATVLDLKKAIQRYMQLKQEREGGIQHISWSYVWRTYHLTSAGEKLTEDRKKLRDYGIRNRDEVSFIKKLRQK